MMPDFRCRGTCADHRAMSLYNPSETWACQRKSSSLWRDGDSPKLGRLVIMPMICWRLSMNRIAICIAIAALIATPAVAADMPVKAPPPAPAPVYSWTGFYVGANGGYGWRDSRTITFTPNDPLIQVLTCGGSAGGTCAPPASFGVAGGFGGYQAGYNWQFNRQWLAGVETDIDGSGIKGTGISNFLIGFPTTPAPSNFTVDQDIKLFGTVRARLGYLPTDSLLIYGTLGFAYGHIVEDVALNTRAGVNASGGFSNNAFFCVSGPYCAVGHSSQTPTGWTAGGGFEYAFWNNLSVKAEYLYVNLGGGDNFNLVMQSFPGFTPSSFTGAFSRTDFHTVRVGLNYQFH